MNFIKPSWPAPSNIHACTTTRLGGFSTTPYAQLNLGDHVGDDANTVEKNRNLIKEHLQLPSDPVWLQQTHSTTLIRSDDGSQNADASFTQQPGIVCVVLTADCLPILLCNQAGTLVAAIHAGWRGLAAGIIENTLEHLPAKPDSLMAWLGPAIGPQKFEVGDDAKEILLASLPEGSSAFQPREEKGKWLCNIYHLARLRLRKKGVEEIYGGEYCTYTQHELFYSYRRDKTTGRMASLIWMS